MRFFLAFYLSKAFLLLIKSLRLGSGSTWPGQMALLIDPLFVEHFQNITNLKVILIVGTNGKTTTASLLSYALRQSGRKVIHNEEGANLINGIASAYMKNGLKRIDGYAVFEVDENSLPIVIKQIQQPFIIVLLNLFRDQLDRYGEVNSIVDKWKKSLSIIQSKSICLVVNADDPQLSALAMSSDFSVRYFTVDETDKKKTNLSHDVDSIYCPLCGNKLRYSNIAYSHLGTFSCSKCTFKRMPTKPFPLKKQTLLAGTYNRYNMQAVLTVLYYIFGTKENQLERLFTGFLPAFGRQEKIQYKKKDWFLLLSKNPAGFNQSIMALREIFYRERVPVLILLNDRIPDGTDVSWIWDVDFETMHQYTSAYIISGDRAYDMAIRIKYGFKKENNKDIHVFQRLQDACNYAITVAEEKQIVVLATYSAMLEIRKIIKGKKLL